MGHGAGLVPAREFPPRLDIEAGGGGRDVGGEGGEGGEPLLRRLGRRRDLLENGGAGKVVLQRADGPGQPFVGAQHGDVRGGQAAARHRPARGAFMPEVVGPVPARGQEDDHKVARRAVAAAVEPDLQLAAAREAVRGGAPVGQGEPTRRAVQKVKEGAGILESAPLTECRVHAVLPEHMEFVQRRPGIGVAGLPEGLDERLAPVVLGKVDEELPLLFADQRPDALQPADETGVERFGGSIPASGPCLFRLVPTLLESTGLGAQRPAAGQSQQRRGQGCGDPEAGGHRRFGHWRQRISTVVASLELEPGCVGVSAPSAPACAPAVQQRPRPPTQAPRRRGQDPASARRRRQGRGRLPGRPCAGTGRSRRSAAASCTPAAEQCAN